MYIHYHIHIIKYNISYGVRIIHNISLYTYKLALRVSIWKHFSNSKYTFNSILKFKTSEFNFNLSHDLHVLFIIINASDLFK